MSSAFSAREGLLYLETEVGPAGRVIFSTRPGGASRGPYAGLNLGLHVGDDPQAVLANREHLARALGLPLEAWVSARQVHGHRVLRVEAAQRGQGAASWDDLPAADALLTTDPGVVLVAYFADCLPLVLADTRGRALVLVHAGWRGTVTGVARAAVAALEEGLGVPPADLWAVLGPHIAPCCYEVGEEVVRELRRALPAYPAGVLRPRGAGRWSADLGLANRLLLQAAGVSEGRITALPYCTACRPDLFYSYRASGGTTGRFAALAYLRGEQ